MRLKLFFLPISIMLGLVIFIWMTKPQWDTYKASKSQLESAQKKLAEAQGNVDNLNKAYSEYASLESDRGLVLNAVPFENKKDELISEIYYTVKDAQVVMTRMSLGDKASDNCFSNAAIASQLPDSAGSATADSASQAYLSCLNGESVSLEVVGFYPNIKKFISEITKMNRYAEISSLTLAKSNSNENQEATAEGETQTTETLISLGLSIKVFSKDAPDGFLLSKNLATPAGKALLSGKLDSDVIEQFKRDVTDKAYRPINVDQYGKDNIFE